MAIAYKIKITLSPEEEKKFKAAMDKFWDEITAPRKRIARVRPDGQSDKGHILPDDKYNPFPGYEIFRVKAPR